MDPLLDSAWLPFCLLFEKSATPQTRYSADRRERRPGLRRGYWSSLMGSRWRWWVLYFLIAFLAVAQSMSDSTVFANEDKPKCGCMGFLENIPIVKFSINPKLSSAILEISELLSGQFFMRREHIKVIVMGKVSPAGFAARCGYVAANKDGTKGHVYVLSQFIGRCATIISDPDFYVERRASANIFKLNSLYKNIGTQLHLRISERFIKYEGLNAQDNQLYKKNDRLPQTAIGLRTTDRHSFVLKRRFFFALFSILFGLCLSFWGWKNLDDNRRLLGAALVLAGSLVEALGLLLFWLTRFPITWDWWL